MHRTIRKVTEDIEAMRFNTAISAMMVLTNELMKLEHVPPEPLESLAKLLHPFAPHLGEELWEMLGHAPSVQNQPWPAYDPTLCEEDEVEIPVQINGKVRGRITIPKDAEQEQAVAAAREALATHLTGKPPRKIIWVPNKILNLIL
jgi:leucyl-tRNA synthetase